MKILLTLLIIGYFIWVCIKKLRDIKHGRHCGCCENRHGNCDRK